MKPLYTNEDWKPAAEPEVPGNFALAFESMIINYNYL